MNKPPHQWSCFIVIVIGAANLSACGVSEVHRRNKVSLRPPGRLGVIWDDPQRCREAVQAGLRQGKDEDKIRVGTWNLRWFPDGIAGDDSHPDRATDVHWLACVLTYLQYDLVGLQEVKLTSRGEQALDLLVTHLTLLTGQRWKWVSDDCPNPLGPHILLLYRPDRLQIDLAASHPEIDPTGRSTRGNDPCPGVLRPALGAYVRSRHGGVDFHFVSTQLDGGNKISDFHNRVAAWRSLDLVLAKRLELEPDTDFVLAGDFNSVGCDDCGLPSAEQEHELLGKLVSSLQPTLISATSSVPCSTYVQGKPNFIDHVIFTETMKEVDSGAQEVSGLCSVKRCADLGAYEIPALVRLSDHCPVTFDIRDVDLD